jgi:hypothetical protein
MQFEEGFYLKYSIIDLSSDDGKTVDPNGRFYVYNPDTIRPEYGHNIILIHGYNADFFEALNAGIDYFDMLAPQIKGPANFILIYWPGNTGELRFTKAVVQTAASTPNFTSAMVYLLKHSTAANPYINFIAHSLGNRECAQTILSLKSQHSLTPVKRFIQLAPAINANSYSTDFKDVPALVERTLAYYSQNDTVLKNDYGAWNIANFDVSVVGSNIQNTFRKDKINNPYYAMGYLGPYEDVPKSVQTSDANAVAGVPVDHGTYLTNQQLIADAAKFINGTGG